MRIQVRVSFLLFLALSGALFAQDASIEWRVGSGVTPIDRTAIIELAMLMGVQRPHRVATTVTMPGGCPLVTVESDVTVTGNQVTWIEAQMHREDWLCWAERTPPLRVGRWSANTLSPYTQERWRFHDGDWHIDVPLSEGVPYDDASRIVMAIRRKTLVNRVGSTLPDIDANTIIGIQHETADREYVVTTRKALMSGDTFWVRIVKDRVEVHRRGGWIV